MSLKIIQIPVGPLVMNATLVMDIESKETIFFDPGDEIERILEIANSENMNISRLIATHCHVDHIAGANIAIEKLGLPLEICPLGKNMLGNVGPIAAAFGYTVSEIKEGGYLSEGDIVNIGKTKFSILHCPGHSPDSLCFYTDGVLIGGDVIFKGSLGRTDLPGGNTEQLMNSITEKIYLLPDETKIYPGHGPETTLGTEKKQNPYLNGTLRLA
jgi:hydroxyacylglutathione hydrolase|tara:strand:+ start:16366 stop:17007 length:642 start_codon:yes stop_codon:yes gene_type:complete